jgi:predicted extracellular nuclease
VERVVQVGADVVFSWDGTLLFDRPPLLVEVEAAGLELTVVAVHLKSLGGIEDPGSAGERVRRKRFEQSLWLADWVQQRRLDTGGAPLMVIGDFNAFEFSDGYVDVIGQITGAPDPAGALLSATEVVDPPLENLVWRISPSQRYSYIYRGSAEVLDHALVSPELRPLVLNLRFARGNADAPDSAASRPGTALRSSDHDGIVVTLGAPVRASGRRHRP